MTALLHMEWLKLRTVRSTWVAVAVTAVAGGLIGTAQIAARPAGTSPPSLAEIALAPAQLAWFVAIVLAVLATAGEFQHRTIRTTLLACPRRVPVLVAKTGAAVAAGALLVAVAALAAVAAAVIAATTSTVGVATGSAADWAAVAGSVAVGAVWAGLATGLGALTRSTAFAIAGVLLWRFVGEGILPMLSRNPGLTRWTPTGAANALVGLGGPTLPVAAAATLLAGYAMAVATAGAVRFLKCDPG